MSNSNPGEDICKNCGHSMQSHFKGKDGRCRGDTEASDYRLWCIANCEKFWK